MQLQILCFRGGFTIRCKRGYFYFLPISLVPLWVQEQLDRILVLTGEQTRLATSNI